MLKDVFLSGRVLIPYFTAGDPNLAFTGRLILAAASAGARMIELGIPFSDPIADGPVIQASHQRALSQNPLLSWKEIFHLVAEIKPLIPNTSIVVMVTAHLVYHAHVLPFFEQAKQAGIEGVIIPDLCIEDAAPYMKSAKQTGVHLIFLASTLCLKKRLEKIVRHASGFLYVISSTGTTGSRDSFAADLPSVCRHIKTLRPSLPTAVGFGIQRKDQVTQVLSFANGAIIGSHFVRLIAESLKQSEDHAIEAVCQEIRQLVS